jgi:RNA recognition motif-containing protein
LGTKLLIEGLPPSFSNQQLKELVAPFGTVVSARMIFGSKGQSLRMGEVELSTPQEAMRAMDKLHESSIQGARIFVFER